MDKTVEVRLYDLVALLHTSTAFEGLAEEHGEALMRLVEESPESDELRRAISFTRKERLPFLTRRRSKT